MVERYKTVGEFIVKGLTLMAGLFTLYYNLRSDIFEAAAMDHADKRIINNRLDILEKTVGANDKILSDVRFDVFKIKAILPKETKIEDK